MATVTIYATAPDRETARRIARALLEQRLVACANLAPIESLYRWKGAIEEGNEVALFLKTTTERAEAAMAALAAEHPYEVPCAVVLGHEGGLIPYRDWIEAETSVLR